MGLIFASGATSQSIDFQVVDDNGLPVTGLNASTLPSAVYSKAGPNNDVPIVFADLATLTTAWASGGVKERGGGYYRFDVPDALFATGKYAIRGEATGKRILAPILEVGNVPTSGSSGARTVAITVDDGTDPIQSATVRVTKGAESYLQETDVDGLAEFNLDDGTWTVAITRAGYSFAGASLVVDGVETTTYSMTQVVISPSAAGLTTGYLTAYDENGAAEAGVAVTSTVAETSKTILGAAYDEAPRTATSDVNGLVEFPNLFKGVVYLFKRGTSAKQYTIRIPANAGSTYELPSIIGGP